MIYDDLEKFFIDVYPVIWDNAQFPIAINDIVRVAKNHNIVDVIEFIATEGYNGVNGAFVRYHNPRTGLRRVEIYHKPNRNEPLANWCWERFTKAKELAHLFIDEPSSMAKTESAIRELAILAANQRSAPSLMNKHINNSEFWAEIAALEMLFPISWRQGFIIESSNSGTFMTSRQIAEMFEIPERYVTYSLEPEIHSTLLKMAMDFNKIRFGYLWQPWQDWNAKM